MATEANITGHLILIMAPSGSGKGQLIDYVRAEFPDIEYALTNTTRERRPGESREGTYRFITNEEFDAKIENGEFIEWAEYSGHKYGTPKSEVLDPLQRGKIVLKEMELQGVLLTKDAIPEVHRTIIYIDGGPWEQLKERILRRSTMTEEEVEMRRQRYEKEVESCPFADIVVHNEEGQLDGAKEEFKKIIENIITTLK